ncbi:hypothetical protein T492DRAFT_839358 [Pavlovales sp. CCMP2436]|nr:hypothetical protein T492DRAFT_839358 [Pavlovales sp. CCMP2436]
MRQKKAKETKVARDKGAVIVLGAGICLCLLLCLLLFLGVFLSAHCTKAAGDASERVHVNEAAWAAAHNGSGGVYAPYAPRYSSRPAGGELCWWLGAKDLEPSEYPGANKSKSTGGPHPLAHGHRIYTKPGTGESEDPFQGIVDLTESGSVEHRPAFSTEGHASRTSRSQFLNHRTGTCLNI